MMVMLLWMMMMMMRVMMMTCILFSILYADIVNFTTMASDCDAPVLVRMLNELVGKFEQLAQVSLCPLPLTYLFSLMSALCSALEVFIE